MQSKSVLTLEEVKKIAAAAEAAINTLGLNETSASAMFMEFL